MKLADLLTSVLGQLQGRKEYGIPLINLLQSQVHHDPSKVVELKDVDGRGAKVMLHAKGKEVDLLSALRAHVAASHHIDLDVDRDGGLTADQKGLRVTVEWRKRTSSERIQDARDRVVTPTGRLTFPHLEAVDEKKARHGASFATAGIVADLSALETRVLRHYVGEIQVHSPVEMTFGIKTHGGRAYWDLESVNCRCAVKEEVFFDDERRFRGLELNEIVPDWLNSKCVDAELPGEFTRARGIELPIVGSSYRSRVEQEALHSKRVGNMVVVTREPTNPHDPRALACWSWHHGTRTWMHSGYVPKALNAGIEEAMRKMGPSVVLVGEMLDRGDTPNPRFKVTAARRYAKRVRKMGA